MVTLAGAASSMVTDIGLFPKINHWWEEQSINWLINRSFAPDHQSTRNLQVDRQMPIVGHELAGLQAIARNLDAAGHALCPSQKMKCGNAGNFEQTHKRGTPS